MSRHHRDSGIATGRQWEASRRQAMDRDGHRCVQCGAAGRFEVHHRKPIHLGGGNEPANLETLCRACHIGKHARRVSEPERAWQVLVAETPYAPYG